jgi:putative flippase GtrA
MWAVHARRSASWRGDAIGFAVKVASWASATELDRRAPSSARLRVGLRRRGNWLQLLRFGLVGASGYAVNLAVFGTLVTIVHLHFRLAAVGAFVVAVSNNYTWNRLWTFREQRGHIGYQGLRFLVVAIVALAANVLLLSLFVSAGLPEVSAQAVAVLLVTPVNFLGNKLWSFH